MGIFSTTVIPTISRPSLARAVNSVLEQSIPEEFEVIVVNDSGAPLARETWQQSGRVRVIETRRRERIVARNAGAALARGRYLHFLDDDDYLVPDALAGIWELARESAADWLYGSSQLVNRQGEPLIQLHHRMEGNCFAQVMAGEWIPLQSSLIRTEAFFAIGGFSHGVLVSQDVDLSRRILLRGDLAGTESLMAVIGMGTESSSTDYANLEFYSRAAREGILELEGVWPRLRSSAGSPYWKGRVARLYLTSAVWNLRHRKPLRSISRSLFGLAALLGAGLSVFSARYWKAMAGPYQSDTFARGEQQARQRSARTELGSEGL